MRSSDCIAVVGLRLFASLCVLVLCNACGGGGGGGSGSGSGSGGGAGGPAAPPSPPEPPLTLAFTPSNAVDSVRLAFAGAQIFLGAAADVANASAELNFNGMKETEIPCPEGGQGTLTFTDGDGNGVLSRNDVVILDGSTCGDVLRRTTLTVASIAAATDRLLELAGRVEFEIEVFGQVPLRGSFDLDVRWNDGEWWRLSDGTQSLDSVDYVGEFSEVDFDLRILGSGVYTFDYSGIVSSPRLGGRFGFAAGPPYRGDWGGFPVEGSLLFTGAGSALRLDAGPPPIDFLTTARYGVDSDGDRQIDHESSYFWSDLNAGLLFGERGETAHVPPIDGNAQPDFESLEISPAEPFTDDDIAVTAVATDPDGDDVTITYRWRRNGWVVPEQTSAVYPAELQEKGDVIVASVRVSDGRLALLRHVSVTVGDSPARLSMPPLPSIQPGGILQTRATITDADGDDFGAPRFVLEHGPAGMEIDETTGDVRWTPAVPLFTRENELNWRIATTDPAIAPISGTVTVVDFDRQYPIMRTGLGASSHPEQNVVVDLDGDGREELLVRGSSLIYELAWNGTGLEQAWAYPFALRADHTSIDAIATGDVDGDGRHEIFVGADAELFKLEGRGRTLAARASPEPSDGLGGSIFCARGLEVADVDLDGAQDLVCLGTRVAVLSAASLDVVWHSPPGEYGRALAVGNVDNDRALEIVTAGGFVFDGAGGANEWVFGGPVDAGVGIGDVDGDAVADIVVIDRENLRMRAYSAAQKTLLWDLPQPIPGEMIVRDLDGDSIAEIVIGYGSSVTVLRYDASGESLVVSSEVESPSLVVAALAYGDVDADGEDELVWSSGRYYAEPDPIVIAGFHPGLEIEWVSPDEMEFAGPFLAAGMATVEPGRRRLIFGSPTAPRLVALDPATGRLEAGGSIGYGPDSVVGTDYDLDGIDEIFYTQGRIDLPYSIYDFAADRVEWSTAPGLGPSAAAARGDLSGDGRDDFAVVNNHPHDPNQLHVLDPYGGVSWRSDELPIGRDVEIADLDRDGVPEIVALLQSAVSVFERNADGDGYVVRASRPLVEPADLAIGDTDGDGELEIYVLAQNGRPILDVIQCLNAELEPLHTLELGEAARSVFIEELGYARKNLAVFLGERGPVGPAVLSIRDPRTGAEISRSPELNGFVPPNSLHYVDVDGDGVPEVAFGTDAGMYVTR